MTSTRALIDAISGGTRVVDSPTDACGHADVPEPPGFSFVLLAPAR